MVVRARGCVVVLLVGDVGKRIQGGDDVVWEYLLREFVGRDCPGVEGDGAGGER